LKSHLGLPICSVLLLAFSPGCLNRQLELTTRRTLNTLPDLNYQQVIDNLAAVAANPGLLPYLAVAGQGSIQVTDNGSSTVGLGIPSFSARSDGLGISASRNVTGTWSLGTITSPDKIRDMQAVYRRAIAGAAQRNPAYLWLNVGVRGDVPQGASYTGRHGNLFAWVMPEGVAGFSELTLTILDIATREDDAPESDASKLPPHRRDARRRNFQVPAAGPVFTPGVG
jgi:hypothetical protein